MALMATMQNQKNFTLQLYQPAEIVPKRTPVRNKIQWRNLKPLPNPFRCTPREHSGSSSLCTIHIWLTNIQGNYIRHIRGRHSNICNSWRPYDSIT